MEKLLVTGIDSILGSNLALALADRFETLGLYQRVPLALPGCRVAAVGWRQLDELDDTIDEFHPNWIIHCGATARGAWDACAEDIVDQTREQLDFVDALVQAADDLGSRLAVMSTDSVFSGPRLFHDENSPATGMTELAEATRELEADLRGSSALVVRTHAYGWSPFTDEKCFAEEIWQQLASEQACTVDAERHATPMLMSDLAHVLEKAYRSQMRGYLHLAGAERISPFHFAAELAMTFGFGGKNIRFCPDEEASFAGLPLKETSLNTWRARRSMKTPMPMVKEGLRRFAEQAATVGLQLQQAGQAALSSHAA